MSKISPPPVSRGLIPPATKAEIGVFAVIAIACVACEVHGRIDAPLAGRALQTAAEIMLPNGSPDVTSTAMMWGMTGGSLAGLLARATALLVARFGAAATAARSNPKEGA